MLGRFFIDIMHRWSNGEKHIDYFIDLAEDSEENRRAATEQLASHGCSSFEFLTHRNTLDNRRSLLVVGYA
jgi:hypothetical protein